MKNITSNGAFIQSNGDLANLDCHHHLTLTVNFEGIEKAHDTFEMGNQKINISTPSYNNINNYNSNFNPSLQASNAFKKMF
jgi:hypothetical protein